ncbi:UDP-N-acetylmuramate dehydrogenase [Vagococcus bubulae]|uniref:UDP-N-acetylenolpyruvoylglucosamine reductase n=1 Tax=Vagococcus bubulae TaxID=1977868 RepID=A0A429ZPI4_9ENTE|nr:UDP-N-acetylmuramate dehydrogenase [Vagococcus bubulae]RST95586.1 UDP-N-acetylenolpyruvoylglucosamine reductase [Vagococcus bubulae]
MTKKNIVQQFPNITILTDEPLSHYTYTKTGGPADFLAFPTSKEEVQSLINFCQENNLEWICLGNASNLIVRDGGIKDVVIMLTKMNQVTVQETTIIAESGAKLIDVTYDALKHDLTGLEFACGIPGSIGGATYMNAGAYGGELADVFYSADVILADGTIKTFYKKDMAFSYRHSVIQELKGIVLSVTFHLEQGEHLLIKEKMDELTYLRESKQPLEYPSCGSVFKRPHGHFTGKLIQDAGLQGHIIGGAQVSTKHAGFIVNINEATATDYVTLIQHIQQVILEQFDVVLEPEVRIIGRK